eukprot:238864-Prorocentrum_minimum.AAC.1
MGAGAGGGAGGEKSKTAPRHIVGLTSRFPAPRRMDGSLSLHRYIVTLSHRHITTPLTCLHHYLRLLPQLPRRGEVVAHTAGAALLVLPGPLLIRQLRPVAPASPLQGGVRRQRDLAPRPLLRGDQPTCLPARGGGIDRRLAGRFHLSADNTVLGWYYNTSALLAPVQHVVTIKLTGSKRGSSVSTTPGCTALVSMLEMPAARIRRCSSYCREGGFRDRKGGFSTAHAITGRSGCQLREARAARSACQLGGARAARSACQLGGARAARLAC